MAIQKMQFIRLTTDKSHMDEMLHTALECKLLSAESATALVSQHVKGDPIQEVNYFEEDINVLQGYANLLGISLDASAGCAHEYTKEELFDHYGIEFDVADIFPDMVEENTDSYGIYTFSDGRDMQGHNFIWTNAGNGEEIDIEIIKDGTPKTDVNLADGGTPAQSTISGKSVTIFHFDTDGQTGYYAEFEYKDLSFSVYGYNLGEEDFISLLSYLLSR